MRGAEGANKRGNKERWRREKTEGGKTTKNEWMETNGAGRVEIKEETCNEFWWMRGYEFRWKKRNNLQWRWYQLFQLFIIFLPMEWSTGVIHWNDRPEWSTGIIHQNNPPEWSTGVIHWSDPPESLGWMGLMDLPLGYHFSPREKTNEAEETKRKRLEGNMARD